MASSGYVEGFVLDVALPGFSETLDVLFIVVSDENTNSHKHVEKKGRCMFRAISETVGNSVQIPSQILLNSIYVCLCMCNSSLQLQLQFLKANSLKQYRAMI